MSSDPPLCPTCDQPASEALGGPEHDWECRNEACPEFGQAVEGEAPAREGRATQTDSGLEQLVERRVEVLAQRVGVRERLGVGEIPKHAWPATITTPIESAWRSESGTAEWTSRSRQPSM